MADESLEERIGEQDTKSSIWDFFVAAYSSSRGVKVLLGTLAAGYSYVASIATAVGFYVATKTIGMTIKYLSRVIRNPFKGHNLIDYIKENIGQYIPWGKQRRPHFMGGTLSTVSYLTGF